MWKLFQFGLHQLRAKPQVKDHLRDQTQVVLRNSPTDLSTMWELLRLAIAWRHQKGTKPVRRLLPLIIWALSHFLFFGLAGTFTSTLLNAGDEVLSISPFCGQLSDAYWDSLQPSAQAGMPTHLITEYVSKAQSRYSQTQQYVQFCTEPSTLCDTLPKKQLSWKSTISSSCPFESSACSETSQSISYDTGYISSHEDLGLNAPEEERLSYRRVTSCTIMKDEQFITDWISIPESGEFPGSPEKKVVDAYYGPNIVGDRNATYSASDWGQYISFDENGDIKPYRINVQSAIAGDLDYTLSDFLPIPQLNMSSADTTLVFLSFSKSYESAVNDPWFSAQKAQIYPLRNGVTTINGTIYVRERPVTTLGCTEQHQICLGTQSASNPTNPNRCTPLMGVDQMNTYPQGALALNLTARQQLTYLRVFQSAVESTFYSVLQGLSQRDTPLLAQKKIQGLVGLGLPDDQWRQETEYWQNLTLANLQRSVIQYGTGQFAANTEYLNLTRSPEQEWLCNNQMIRSNEYQSFSFLGLMLIVVFGAVIIIAGTCCEDVVALHLGRQKHPSFRQESWAKDDALELHRIATRRQSHDRWSYSSNGVPISQQPQAYRMDPIHEEERSDNSSRLFRNTIDEEGQANSSRGGSPVPGDQEAHGGYEIVPLGVEDALRAPNRNSYRPPGRDMYASSSSSSLIL